jgi:Tol biopolymer transport system component
MADLRASLEELRDDLSAGRLSSGAMAAPVTTTSGPHPAARRPPWLALAALAAAAVAIAAYAFWPREASPGPGDTTGLAPMPLTTYAGSEFAGGFSPDGSQLVFAWDGERSDNSDIYVKVIGPGTPLRLTSNPAQDSDPRWSPDGRSIAFFRLIEPGKVSLVLLPPLGGTERVLGEFYPRIAIVPLIDMAWTADSRFLLLAAGRARGEPNRLHRVSVETGEVTTVIEASSTDGIAAIAVSPDGQRLAAAMEVGTETITVYSLSPDGMPSGPNQFPNTGSAIELQWAPDSRSVLFRRTVNTPGPLYRLAVDGDGTVSPLLLLGPGAAQPIVSAPRSRLVFTRTIRDANIWRVPLSGPARTPEKIAVSSFREVAPHYSPDGSRLAFHSNRSGSVQIWVSDADGSNPVQVTSMDDIATTGTPRWSPDGTRLAFDSNTTGTYQIYVINAGGGQPRQVTRDAARSFTAWWSPDGRWLYYTSDRTGRLEIWRIPSDGGTAEQITRTGASSGSISPDGQWLYFIRNEGIDGLWRMPIAGGPETKVIDTLWRFNYVATNSGVHYTSRPEAVPGRGTVRYFDFATRRHTDIAPLDAPVDLGMAVSPDNRYLLFTKIDHLGADLMLVEKFR